jgi:Pyruvate/2-oxoacid:ferredoxin oxidoreductase gamma subunit
MEREILWTGIGGQGVQLAAQVVAHAAMAEGRDVQMFGSYGGMMRGGNTDATLVIGDRAVEAPPTVDAAWAAIVMHPDYADPILARVQPGGLVLRNVGLFDGELARTDLELVDVPAKELAVQAGHAMAESMVMLGALSALSGLVGLDALEAGVATCVPSYRQQHVDLNLRAIRAGAAAVVRSPSRDAWSVEIPAGREA